MFNFPFISVSQNRFCALGQTNLFSPEHLQLKNISCVHSKFTDNTLYALMKELAPSMESTIPEVLWHRNTLNGEQLMAPVISEYGYCFAFNSLNSHEIYTYV